MVALPFPSSTFISRQEVYWQEKSLVQCSQSLVSLEAPNSFPSLWDCGGPFNPLVILSNKKIQFYSMIPDAEN